MTEGISIEQQYYEKEEFWREERLDEKNRKRIEHVYGLIPYDVRSIADVGCGNGVFINYVASQSRKFERLIGVDRSKKALSFVKTDKLECDIDQIPFKDGDYDLVVCFEVLEHLPLSVFNKALTELCRISGKYVMVTVPNEQDLSLSMSTCPHCSTKFNPNYHMHSFAENDIRSLLDEHGFEAMDVFVMHRREHHFTGLRRYYEWKNRRRRGFHPNAICPVCGYTKNEESRARASVAQQAQHGISIKRLVQKVWPKVYKYEWIGALYRKEQA